MWSCSVASSLVEAMGAVILHLMAKRHDYTGLRAALFKVAEENRPWPKQTAERRTLTQMSSNTLVTKVETYIARNYTRFGELRKKWRQIERTIKNQFNSLT